MMWPTILCSLTTQHMHDHLSTLDFHTNHDVNRPMFALQIYQTLKGLSVSIFLYPSINEFLYCLTCEGLNNIYG